MKRNIFVFFLLVALGLSVGNLVHISYAVDVEATGLVVKVVDGDTIEVDEVGRIRLADIDAPEMEAPRYDAVKSYLNSLVDQREVVLDMDPQKDQWDRIINVVYGTYNAMHLLYVNKARLYQNVMVILKNYPNEVKGMFIIDINL